MYCVCSERMWEVGCGRNLITTEYPPLSDSSHLPPPLFDASPRPNECPFPFDPGKNERPIAVPRGFVSHRERLVDVDLRIERIEGLLHLTLPQALLPEAWRHRKDLDRPEVATHAGHDELHGTERRLSLFQSVEPHQPHRKRIQPGAAGQRIERRLPARQLLPERTIAVG